MPPIHRRRRSALAATSCLLLLPIRTPASAQSRVDVWTTENGLPQNSINDMLQTRDGFLWLATSAASRALTAPDSSSSIAALLKGDGRERLCR